MKKEQIAKRFAESEFEKYRVIQDYMYKSDFDRLLEDSQDLSGTQEDDK